MTNEQQTRASCKMDSKSNSHRREPGADASGASSEVYACRRQKVSKARAPRATTVAQQPRSRAGNLSGIRDREGQDRARAEQGKQNEAGEGAPRRDIEIDSRGAPTRASHCNCERAPRILQRREVGESGVATAPRGLEAPPERWLEHETLVRGVGPTPGANPPPSRAA